jgi:hypothetical protein
MKPLNRKDKLVSGLSCLFFNFDSTGRGIKGEKMKLLLSILIALMMLLPITVWAADTPTSADVFKLFPNLNVQGDTAYFMSSGKFAFGIGSDMATYDNGLASLRIEVLKESITDKEAYLIGTALMVNLPKFLQKTGGVWAASVINPSLGPIVGYDFKNKKVEFGLLVTIIKLEF